MSTIRVYTPPLPAIEANPTTLFEVIDTAEQEGWEVGPPPGLSDDALAADVELALTYPCDRCGWHAGCAYAALHCGDEYRAFAVCGNCGHANEV
jgi:hypothetical protein